VKGNHCLLDEVTPIPSEEAPRRSDLPTSDHCFPFVLIVCPKRWCDFHLIRSKFSIAGIYKTAFSSKNNPSQSSAEIRPPVIKPLQNRSPTNMGPYVSIAAKRTLWSLSS
jgi:hypothetical protein